MQFGVGIGAVVAVRVAFRGVCHVVPVVRRVSVHWSIVGESWHLTVTLRQCAGVLIVVRW